VPQPQPWQTKVQQELYDARRRAVVPHGTEKRVRLLQEEGRRRAVHDHFDEADDDQLPEEV
jgi:hypothetical protein